MASAELRSAVERGDFAAADQVAQKIIDGGDASADGLFESLCVRSSIAALEHAPVQDVRPTLRQMDRTDSYHAAMADYVEGTLQLSVSSSIARSKFTAALDADPSFALARLGLAAVWFIEGNYKLCFRECKHVLGALGSLAPNVVRVLLGVCAFRMNQPDHARKCYARALEVEPEDPTALLASFAFHTHQRNTAEAARLVTLLTRAAPSAAVLQRHADFVFYRALATGRLAEAEPKLLTQMQTAERLGREAGSPSIVGYAKLQQGRLQHAKGNTAGARELYDAALKSAPTLAAAAIHRIAILHDADTPLAEVMQELRQVMKGRGSDPRLLLIATELSSRLGQHSEALRFARLLLETTGRGLPEAFAVAAWVTRLDGETFAKYTQAAVDFRQHLNQQPDPAHLANLAVVQEDIAKLQDAARTARGLDLSTADGDDGAAIPEEDFPYLFNYALLSEADAPEKARKIYIRLVKHRPTDPHSFERLVMLSVERGRTIEALKWSRLFAAVHPTNTKATVLTTYVLQRCGMQAKAHEFIRSLHGRTSSPDVAMCLASMYLGDSQRSSDPKKKLEFSLRGFHSALRHDRRNILAAHGASCAIAAQGQSPQAGLLLERVAEVDCNVPEVKAGVKEHRFNLSVATRAFHHAITLMKGHTNPSKRQRCALAYCHLQLEQYSDAIAILDAALKVYSRDATISTYLVTALYISVCSAVLRNVPLTSQEGDQALDRMAKALSLCKYAQARKSNFLASIRKSISPNGNLVNAVRKRMADRVKETEHATQMEDKWRERAAEFHETKAAAKEEQLAKEMAEQKVHAEIAAQALLAQERALLRWQSQVDPTLHQEGVPVDDAVVDVGSYREGGLGGQLEHLAQEVALNEEAGDDLASKELLLAGLGEDPTVAGDELAVAAQSNLDDVPPVSARAEHQQPPAENDDEPSTV